LDRATTYVRTDVLAYNANTDLLALVEREGGREGGRERDNERGGREREREKRSAGAFNLYEHSIRWNIRFIGVL
jgi:hypothetical protein